MKKVELLAPAGNMSGFLAVLRAGADAVYMAGSRYGARAYADNFTDEELVFCIRYAHFYNRKVYITVNTLIKENELESVFLFLKPLYEAGLDGVIVQDLGLITSLKDYFPRLEVHASTQLNLLTSSGANLLKGKGISRIVPGRELSLQEIIKLKKESGLEVECFVHGAICYCYSGQCLFSSVLGGRSGNRGKCAQPCRLPYSNGNGKDIYPLSLKDMCTVSLLPKLIEAGIDSFKIEGRMKKPEYAAGVTAIYRKYIDMYYETGDVHISKEDMNILDSLYIRSELSEGYYSKYNGKDMVSLTNPAYKGADDRILTDIRNRFVKDAPSCDLLKPVASFIGYFITGSECSLTAICGDVQASVTGDVVSKAINRPILEEDIFKQLKKLGNTSFSCGDDIQVYLSEDAFINVKSINELRRNAIDELEKAIITANGFDYFRDDTNILNVEQANIPSDQVTKTAERSQESYSNTCRYSFSVYSINQIRTILQINDFSNARIYVPEEMALRYEDELYRIGQNNFFIALTYIRRDKDKKYYDSIAKLVNSKLGIKGLLVRSIEDISFAVDLKNQNPNLQIHSDYCIYGWNSKSIEFLSDYFDTLGLPLELSAGAHKQLLKAFAGLYFERMVYGRIPLMQSANCVRKTVDKCLGSDEPTWYYMKDRTGRQLPVLTDCAHCRNTIFNAVPSTVTNLADNPFKSDNLSFRIDFSDEKEDEIIKVLHYFLNPAGKPEWEYTTGFEKHSTE